MYLLSQPPDCFFLKFIIRVFFLIFFFHIFPLRFFVLLLFTFLSFCQYFYQWWCLLLEERLFLLLSPKVTSLLFFSSTYLSNTLFSILFWHYLKILSYLLLRKHYFYTLMSIRGQTKYKYIHPGNIPKL